MPKNGGMNPTSRASPLHWSELMKGHRSPTAATGLIFVFALSVWTAGLAQESTRRPYCVLTSVRNDAELTSDSISTLNDLLSSVSQLQTEGKARLATLPPAQRRGIVRHLMLAALAPGNRANAKDSRAEERNRESAIVALQCLGSGIVSERATLLAALSDRSSAAFDASLRVLGAFQDPAVIPHARAALSAEA